MPPRNLILATTHAQIEDYSVPATPGTPVDLSCFVISIEPSGDTEMVDTPTFCDPSSQGEGTTTFELSVNWAVSIDGTESLAEVIEPFVGKEVRLTWWADGATHAEQVICGMPINPALVGTWEVGSRVESSTTHALRTAPARVTAPAEALGAMAAGPDYESMTVAELQALATERGLPTSGTKAELIERLTAPEEPPA